MNVAKRFTFCLLLSAGTARTQTPQNPSPMVEHTRAHQRVPETQVKGQRWKLSLGSLLLAEGARWRKPTPLVVHFHGSAWLAEQSVFRREPRAAVLSVHIGPGSGIYRTAFSDPSRFRRLLEEAGRAPELKLPVEFGPVVLTAYSAGHGAIAAILKHRVNWEQISAAVLADGMHTGYVPAGKPGPLDTENLESFVDFAREAVAGRKQMLVTHSEVFPGTFASTTETADFLLDKLGLKRRPLLKWGPLGMQQLSEVRTGGFTMLGFAGNSGPDHTDHFHALEHWLRKIKM